MTATATYMKNLTVPRTPSVGTGPGRCEVFERLPRTVGVTIGLVQRLRHIAPTTDRKAVSDAIRPRLVHFHPGERSRAPRSAELRASRDAAQGRLPTQPRRLGWRRR